MHEDKIHTLKQLFHILHKFFMNKRQQVQLTITTTTTLNMHRQLNKQQEL